MQNKRGYSTGQFARSDFDANGYEFMDEEGTFYGRLLFKRWGKSKNILAYLLLDDGRKIICSGFQKQGHLGIPDIEMDSRVSATFKTFGRGKTWLTEMIKL